MTLKTAQDLVALREIGQIVAQVLKQMGQALEPGMTTLELDQLGERLLTEAGARSAPRLMYKFPGATCISVNHKVAHGIPGDNVLQAGDLVNIDVSAEKNGYFGDNGSSFNVPPAQPQRERLCRDGQVILKRALAQARHGRPLNLIGKTIESEARSRGYTVIRNLGGHGVGRTLHEEPSFISPYFDPADKRMLKEGMVVAIEPFISTGANAVEQDKDGWTLYTDPKYDTVQFEHSIVIQRGRPIILTKA